MRLIRTPLERLTDAALAYVRSVSDSAPQAAQEAASAALAGGGVLTVTVAVCSAGVVVGVRAMPADGEAFELTSEIVAAGKSKAGGLR